MPRNAFLKDERGEIWPCIFQEVFYRIGSFSCCCLLLISVRPLLATWLVKNMLVGVGRLSRIGANSMLGRVVHHVQCTPVLVMDTVASSNKMIISTRRRGGHISYPSTSMEHIHVTILTQGMIFNKTFSWLHSDPV